MLPDFLQYLNWIDILLVCIVIRILYIGHKNGVIVEFFKLIAVGFSIFITLHYFSDLGRILTEKLSFTRASFHAVAFGFLWLFVTLVFKLIRDGLLSLMKIEAHPFLDKWGGFFFAVFRSAMVCSLLILMLIVTRADYVVRTAKRSFIRPYISDLAPNVYRGCYDGFVSKLFPTEKLNRRVFKLKNFDF